MVMCEKESDMNQRTAYHDVNNVCAYGQKKTELFDRLGVSKIKLVMLLPNTL